MIALLGFNDSCTLFLFLLCFRGEGYSYNHTAEGCAHLSQITLYSLLIDFKHELVSILSDVHTEVFLCNCYVLVPN